MRKSLDAGSAGTQLPIKITPCSLLANALALSVTFILSAFEAGWMLRNKLKIAIASSPTTGNPLNVKFARRPIP